MKHQTISMLRRSSKMRRLLMLSSLVFVLSAMWAGAESPGPTPGAVEGELSRWPVTHASKAVGLQLLPETIVVSNCPGSSQVHTLSLDNQTGQDDTFTLAYDVSTLNGLLTGPESVTVANGATETFEVKLTPDPCPTGDTVEATVTASGDSASDVTTITSAIATHEFASVAMSAPTWAGLGHPVDGCSARNSSDEWVTYVIGDTGGALTGFWGYNHDTNSWFVPSDIEAPANRWAPDWAYDPDINRCYLTGGATTQGAGDLTEAYAWEPVEGVFWRMPDLDTARNFHDSWVATIDGVKHLCVGGGVNGSGGLDSTQCYDLELATEVWEEENETIAAYPTIAWGAADGVNRAAGGDQLWFVAGVQNGQVSDAAHYWDDADDQWHTAGATGFARYRVEGDFFEDRFYQLGGSKEGFEASGSAVAGWLDESTWKWAVLPELPNLRIDDVVAVTADSLWVVDGYGSSSSDYVDLWQACSDTSTMGLLVGTITDLGRYCAEPGRTCAPTSVLVDPPGTAYPADAASGVYGPILLPDGTYDATPQVSGYPDYSPLSTTVTACVTTTNDWDLIRQGIEVSSPIIHVNGGVGIDSGAFLRVFNAGCVHPLIFSVSETTPLDWVTLGPPTEDISLPDLGSHDVDVTLNCSALGDFSGALRLDHNDPCKDPLEVQLNLHCLEDVEIFTDGFESGDTTAWSTTVP